MLAEEEAAQRTKSKKMQRKGKVGKKTGANGVGKGSPRPAVQEAQGADRPETESVHGGIPFSQLLKLLERVARCEEEIGTGPAADGADLKKRVDSLEAILGVASEGSIVERLGAIEGLIGSEATLEAAPVAAAAPADWLAVEEAREEAERAARAEAAAEAARVQAMERAGACLAE